MTFEVRGSNGISKSVVPYIKIACKEYENNKQKKLMVKIIDVTQSILYE